MPHPRTDFAPSLPTLPGTARELGYRMPAEWEPLARVWLTPPFNEETWPGCLPQAQQQFANLMEAMRPYVTIATTQELGVKTDDSWIRDFGPIFVVRGDPNQRPTTSNAGPPHKARHDFCFNSWGGKYE